MRLSQLRNVVFVVAATTLGACKEITVPNYNNPNLEQLTNNPTANTVNTAIVGIVISLRDRVGTEASAMGILGKESYNLDQAEPRNVLGYLQGPIEPGGFVQDLSWTYWAMNGNDSYGLLNSNFNALSLPAKVYSLLCFDEQPPLALTKGTGSGQCGSTGPLPNPQ